MKTKLETRTVRSVDTIWLNAEIGKRLRALRERRGLTLQQVSVGLGVTRAAVNNWELGRAQKNFVLTTIYNLALFYKVPVKRLLP